MKKSCRVICRFVLIFGVFCVMPLFAKSKKADSSSGANTVAVTDSGEKKLSRKEKKAQQIQQKAEEKLKAKEAKKNSKLKIVGTVEDEGVFQARTVDVTVEPVRYLMKGKVGSFQLYAVPDSGSAVPLFAGYDEFTSSFYSLLAGKKEYKLTNNIGIVIGARQSSLGGQIVYIVPDVARVFVKFEHVQHDDSIESEIIKVTSTITNRGKKKETFALKSVLDTVLGEQFGPHFSSAEEKTINSERQYRKMEELKWIKSANSRIGLQFLFNGADVTPPEVVSLSNKDLLALQKWIPEVQVSRTFDSVLSYNNSALCINWEKSTLAPGETATYVYYMALSVDDPKCDGEKFIAALNKKIEDGKVDQKYSVRNFEDLYNNAVQELSEGKVEEAYKDVQTLLENPENANERLYTLKSIIEQQLSPETPRAPDEPQTSSGFDKSKILPEHLNYQYIQSLIDRINELDENDDVDRAEIIKLSAELDAIIELLRPMNGA